MKVHPVDFEVFKNLFLSIAEEMGVTLCRTGFSPNIKERLDYSCAVYDADGETIAQRRKLKPTHVERTVFGEGDGSDLAVHDTPLGRVGAAVGEDDHPGVDRVADPDTAAAGGDRRDRAGRRRRPAACWPGR